VTGMLYLHSDAMKVTTLPVNTLAVTYPSSFLSPASKWNFISEERQNLDSRRFDAQSRVRGRGKGGGLDPVNEEEEMGVGEPTSQFEDVGSATNDNPEERSSSLIERTFMRPFGLKGEKGKAKGVGRGGGRYTFDGLFAPDGRNAA